MKPIHRVFLAAIALAFVGVTARDAGAESVLVFAAASAAPAVRAAAEPFTRETGIGVAVSGAATSALAQQILRGAPAQLVITAHPQWMTYLRTYEAIDATRQRALLGNTLVLIAPKGGGRALDPAPGFAIAAALGDDGRLAMGDPDHVPAGLYAKQALITLGVWDSVAARLAPASNAVAALTFVARGEAPLGIVYRTDAALSDAVEIVGTLPSASHDTVQYDIAPVGHAPSDATLALLNHLTSPAARPVFERFGFRFASGI